jgi:hypothetical protein
MTASNFEEFRSHLAEFQAAVLAPRGQLSAQVARSYASVADTAPARRGANIHATGIGLAHDNARTTELAYKIFVFPGSPPTDEPEAWREYPVEIVPLPIQKPYSAVPNRLRTRPIPGGVSVAPYSASYVGTLGCILHRENGELLALSNNHVLAGTDSYAAGTQICQCGPENVATQQADVFAVLADIIPLSFNAQLPNEFDVATARIIDGADAGTGTMLGIPSYSPASITQLQPGVRVTKSGRTSSVTTGTVVNVAQNIQVDYNSRIAVFSESFQIAGDEGLPFSLPGDSGSLVLRLDSGGPAALLFAGDGVNTFASDISKVCLRLGAWPI